MQLSEAVKNDSGMPFTGYREQLRGRERHMYKSMRSLTLAAITFLGMAASARDLSLHVEIKQVEQTVLQNEDFQVEPIIRNTGAEAITLQIWSCSYSRQWASDNETVKVKQSACKKNYIKHVKLNPGQTYTHPLVLRVGFTRTRPVVFRLKFNPEGSTPGPDTPFIWSNPVTLNVAAQ